MQSLIQQIQSGRLWDFPGGIHPPENKKQSNQSPISSATLPHEIVLPLKQHIGKAGNLIVSEGERVLKGQALTEVNATFMLAVHAPTSGQVKAIEKRTIAHPSGLSELCVIIEPDGQDTWVDLKPTLNYQDESAENLIEIIRRSGISGMGGAGFPTAKKIQSGQHKTKIFILNAAECEPYITADDVLMQHYADEIVKGISIMQHILQPELTIIGIEDNKPDAIKALEAASKDHDFIIRVIPTKYPSGGEKQLIKVLTNLEVPTNGIPADIGVLVQNIGSLYAIKEAIIDGKPLIKRIVTLTGQSFPQPQNVWVHLGTPVNHLLEQFDCRPEKRHQRLIMGGPMMGFTLPHGLVPITKTSNCILAPKKKEITAQDNEMACIRCSLCADACPVSLLPQQLQWHAKAQEYNKCEELNLKDCIECGACAYVCPSEIPLVQYYRQAKAEIKHQKFEKEAAERARLRFEEKNARMERDKQERENRFKKAAEARRKDMKTSGGDDAIAAAIARVQAKNDKSHADTTVKPAVAAAIARAKAKQAEALAQGKQEPDNTEMAKLREKRKQQARERKAQKTLNASEDSSQDENANTQNTNSKQDAVAAAIARAKARKTQQQAGSPETQSESPAKETTSDPKKAAVAAAIARAKARKAQQQAESTETQSESPTQETTDDPKKAAVAAAIARAKARKAQQQAESTETQSESPTQETTDDPKKAAVAAAIARAKARKAQQQAQSSEKQSESPNQESKENK
ncbi:electron transport complex subunit RsxC [Vibrio sp.]|nr:electron transport complex subunit RsxC [Vibrio sp.]